MTKRGRRFTYQNEDEKPVTISMRLPKALHTRLEEYAAEHRISLSELVRDGLELRLSDKDPLNPSGWGDGTPANILREMREGFAQVYAMMQALERPTIPVRKSVPAKHTAREPERQEGLTNHDPDVSVQGTIPEYDTSRYYLGKLCKRGHEWANTGQSLLRKTKQQCAECDREHKRERRQTQRKAATT